MDNKNIFYFYESNKQWDNNHSVTDAITRYTAHGMDYHIAIHDFNAHKNVDEYCKPHSHPEENEINIIFSRNDFIIKTTIDDQDFVINKNVEVHNKLLNNFIL